MKSFVFSITIVLSIFIACSAQAQTLSTYDDFSGPYIDPLRWLPRNVSSADDLWAYEGGFRILKGKLSYYNLAYGTKLATDGTESMRRQLFLREVSGVTSIETSIQIMKNGNKITGCPTPGYSEPSETRIGFGGSFFNDGSGVSPGNNDYTGDIYVSIGLLNLSNSTTIPPGYMGVGAKVRQCVNSDCSDSNPLFNTSFNDLFIKFGKKTMLRITLDKGAKRFTFQVGKKIVETYIYPDTLDDSQAPGAANGGMRIEVDHYLANCPAERTVGWADVAFDYVSVSP